MSSLIPGPRRFFAALSASVNAVDAVVLAEKSDGVVLVVKNEVASPKDLIEAKNRLSQVGISLLGSIVIDA